VEKLGLGRDWASRKNWRLERDWRVVKEESELSVVSVLRSEGQDLRLAGGSHGPFPPHIHPCDVIAGRGGLGVEGGKGKGLSGYGEGGKDLGAMTSPGGASRCMSSVIICRLCPE
jgi:hypothetical protein